MFKAVKSLSEELTHEYNPKNWRLLILHATFYNVKVADIFSQTNLDSKPSSVHLMTEPI